MRTSHITRPITTSYTPTVHTDVSITPVLRWAPPIFIFSMPMPFRSRLTEECSISSCGPAKVRLSILIDINFCYCCCICSVMTLFHHFYMVVEGGRERPIEPRETWYDICCHPSLWLSWYAPSGRLMARERGIVLSSAMVLIHWFCSRLALHMHTNTCTPSAW